MAPTDPHGGLRIRPATSQDADTVARLYLNVRAASVPAMPPQIHTDDEVLAHTREVIERHEVWLALDPEPEAYAELEPGWLHSLYVLPQAQGSEVGSALLDLVKARCPEGFELWVFQSNEPARTFYAHRGLVEVERTDGAENEERAPDVRMRWPGREADEPAAPSPAPTAQPSAPRR